LWEKQAGIVTFPLKMSRKNFGRRETSRPLPATGPKPPDEASQESKPGNFLKKEI
jgi:hypothetical protein